MKKTVPDTSKGPDPKSIRTKKRANRNFKSTTLSTRKGRRADKRSAIACTINGTRHEPGTKVPNRLTSKLEFTAGGGMNYHTS